MTHNTRPADFPTDAEIDAMRPMTTLAALLDAFVGSPEWDEHDVRVRMLPARWAMEDVRSGEPFVPERYFLPGTPDYQMYVAAYEATQR